MSEELVELLEKRLDIGIEWIERNQDRDGSWSYDKDFYSKFISLSQRRFPSTKTVDTTSSCARHIYTYRKKDTPEIKKALNFLRGRQDIEDGAFENDWLKRKCPLATAMVVKNIAAIDKYEEIVRSAHFYIKRSRLKDGSWRTPGEYQMQNSFNATCMCAQFLNFLGVKKVVEEAVKYIFDKQTNDGSWILDKKEKIIIQEQTMSALDTLIECGYKDSEPARKAKDYLWSNPYEEIQKFPYNYLKWNNTLLKFGVDRTNLLDMSYSNIIKILIRQKPDGSFKLYHTGLGYHVVGELLDLSRLLS